VSLRVPTHKNSSCKEFDPVTLVGDLGELADHNVQGRAEQEPGHDRTRQELSDPAQPEYG
jgi:hypothetical protein